MLVWSRVSLMLTSEMFGGRRVWGLDMLREVVMSLAKRRKWAVERSAWGGGKGWPVDVSVERRLESQVGDTGRWYLSRREVESWVAMALHIWSRCYDRGVSEDSSR